MPHTPSSAGRVASGPGTAVPRARFGAVRLTVAALSLALGLALTPTVASLPATTLAAPDDAFQPGPPPTIPATLYPEDAAAAGTTAATGTTGQAIADFALQFYGSPYVYAGNTPAGFDCSGFTQYVVLNVTGLDIGHGTEGQLAYGTPVDAANLLPGDLIYFAGTWGPGITHTGIYIGDGQFIHAENESTGVTISSLWGSYAAYYYTATRIG